MRNEIVEWRNEVEIELRKKFYEEEADNIISYYEEMIEDRLADGEDIDEVLRDYQPKKLAKMIVPMVVVRRDERSVKQVSRSAWQILLWIFSTPILIPLGIVYVVLLLVCAIVAFVMALVPVVVVAYQVIIIVQRLYYGDVSTLDIVGGIGLSLFAAGITSIISVLLVKLFIKIMKATIKLFAKIFNRKRKVKVTTT